MVKANFERDVGALRGLLKSKKVEIDPYKAIIYIENFVLEYGMKVTQRTVFILLSGIPVEEQIEILLDVLQHSKLPNELTINNKKYAGIKR